MAKKTETKAPYIHIPSNDIITTVVDAALTCYGVAGIATKHEIRDIKIKDPKKGKYEEGVLILRFPDHTFAVAVYLILAENLKITETLRESQKRIKYILDKKYPKRCRYASVYGVGLSSLDN